MTTKSLNSEPEYDWKFERNTLIPMPDGVHLAADAFVPVKDGKPPAVPLPVIIGTYSPYHKDLIMGGFGGSTRYDMGIYFARRGYYVYFVDVRGTGNSEGTTSRLYSEQEQKDSYEVVEWLAKQAWCNGNVGIYGISYGFYSTVLCAATTPPHLKAIVPFSGGVDWYSAGFGYEGGNFTGHHFTGFYAANMIAMNYSPPEYMDPEGRWFEVWKQHIENNIPWFLDWLEHEVDGPYYHIASVAKKYDKVKAASLVINGWHDYYPSEPVKFFQNITCPKKLLAGPWIHEFPDRARPGPRIDGMHEMLKWFDYWLKGVQNGVMDEPAVSLYVQDYTHPDLLRDVSKSWQNGRWRLEDEFPPKGTAWKPLYLQEGHSLSWDAPKGRDAEDSLNYDPSAGTTLALYGGTYGPIGMPIDQRGDEALSLVYSTPPLDEEIEITGQPRLVLHCSSSADIGMFVAKLCDEAPDGTSVLLSRCSLNTAHRESSTNPRFVVPGEIFELKFATGATSYRFDKGHRIKLCISCSDYPFLWPTPKRALNKVFHGAGHQSRIEIPIVPKRENPKSPSFLPPPPVSNLATVVVPNYWRVTHDENKGNVTVEWGVCVSFRTDSTTVVEQENRLWQTVNRKNPALSTVDSLCRFTVSKPNIATETLAKVVVTSDESYFHVLSSVDIKRAGSTFLHRDWNKTYRRNFR